MNKFRQFLMGLDKHIGRENGYTVKQKANELEVKKSRVYLWNYKTKKLGIPLWNHRIPHKKEKLFCISKQHIDFDDTKRDLARRVNLALFHAVSHDNRMKEIGLKPDITVELKRVIKGEKK